MLHVLHDLDLDLVNNRQNFQSGISCRWRERCTLWGEFHEPLSETVGRRPVNGFGWEAIPTRDCSWIKRVSIYFSMGPNGLVFILVVGACRAVGWEKLGRWYDDLLVTYLVHNGESQVASPVFQCGPPKVVPQQISDAGVVTGVSLITDDARGGSLSQAWSCPSRGMGPRWLSNNP